MLSFHKGSALIFCKYLGSVQTLNEENNTSDSRSSLQIQLNSVVLACSNQSHIFDNKNEKKIDTNLYGLNNCRALTHYCLVSLDWIKEEYRDEIYFNPRDFFS